MPDEDKKKEPEKKEPEKEKPVEKKAAEEKKPEAQKPEEKKPEAKKEEAPAKAQPPKEGAKPEPEAAPKKAKKINRLTLKELEKRIQLVQEKMGSLTSHYAQQLLKRKEQLFEKTKDKGEETKTP
jgi:hypothetical protein